MLNVREILQKEKKINKYIYECMNITFDDVLKPIHTPIYFVGQNVCFDISSFFFLLLICVRVGDCLSISY